MKPSNDEATTPIPGPPDNRLWNYKDIASYINVPEDTVQRQISKHPEFPAPIRLGKHIRYQPEDIKEYLKTLRTQK